MNTNTEELNKCAKPCKRSENFKPLVVTMRFHILMNTSAPPFIHLYCCDFRPFISAGNSAGEVTSSKRIVYPTSPPMGLPISSATRFATDMAAKKAALPARTRMARWLRHFWPAPLGIDGRERDPFGREPRRMHQHRRARRADRDRAQHQHPAGSDLPARGGRGQHD